jgi:putative restriction endonuclease
MVLSSYNNTCCITGLQKPELLVASHIRRWADDPENRMNPRNGLALNALHDRAFEAGLIAIGSEYKILLCSALKKSKDPAVGVHFLPYEGAELRLPTRFLPDDGFLKGHLERRFLG